MKKAFILAVLLAIVAMPMAFAGVGFCRSMPCCPPHSAHLTSDHQPDCCNPSNCGLIPEMEAILTIEPAPRSHIAGATSSPDFCTEATIWNVKKCFGFVTDSNAVIASLGKRAGA